MKWILTLIYLLFSWAALASNVLTSEKELTLVKGQEFFVPKGAVGAYAINNDNLVEINQTNQKVKIKAKHVGKLVIQILHTDGSITNYKIKIDVDKQTNYFSKTSLYKGYNVVFTAEYMEMKSSGRIAQNSKYRGRLLVTTKVGTQGKFLGNVEYRELYPTYFYVRGDYKKVYYGYGDLQLQSNAYKPSLISQPRLRQHTAGWNGENFDFDLWSGQLSPIPFSPDISRRVGNPRNTSLFNSYDNRFSGSRMKYDFTGGSSIFGSTWYNHEYKRTIPYVGYTYKNSSLGIANSSTIGNTSEAPVFANSFKYRVSKNHWTLQSLAIDYLYANKGFDTLLFESKLPVERFTAQTSFFSGNKFAKKGSSYLDLGYSYSLNGFTTSNSYGGAVGWKNSNLDLRVDGNKGQQEFSYLPGKVFDNWRYSPSFELGLNPNPKGNVKYTLGASQSFSSFNYVNGETKSQETTLTYSGRHKNGFGAALGMARFNIDAPARDRNGFRILPRIDYRKENVVIFAQGNLTFVDRQDIKEPTSSYILGQERFSGGVKYIYNQQHIVEGKFISSSDGINNRQYSSMILGYTFKLGDSNKSIISILDSRKVSGTIFEDLNLNGIKDSNEKGIPGIKISVESDKGDRASDVTDNNGFYKISGLKEEIYNFTSESNELYSLSNTPGNLNFKMQEGYEYSLPAVKTRNIEVDIEGTSEESLYLSVDCPEKQAVNQVPLMAGTKIYVSSPKNNNCSMSVNLLGTKENISVTPEKIMVNDIVNNKAHFKISSSKIILGQAFYDKNKNGFYEFGEEIKGANVVFGRYSMKTDENGIFTTAVKPEDKKVIFNKVQGYKCKMRNPEIDDFTGKKLIQISCQK